MSKKIEIKCEGKTSLPLDQLHEFQGNLKALDQSDYNKLKNKIIRQGFSFPVFVWKAEDGTCYLLDGHQRVRTVTKMQEEGYEVPDIPADFVQAETYKEAKEKLLSAASQFGKVTGQGLYEFISENEFEPDYIYDNFTLPEIEFDKFNKEYYELTPSDPDPGKELEEEEFQEFDHACPKCGFEWTDKDKK